MHSMPTWSAAAGSPCRPAVRSPASTRRSVHENTFTRLTAPHRASAHCASQPRSCSCRSTRCSARTASAKESALRVLCAERAASGPPAPGGPSPWSTCTVSSCCTRPMRKLPSSSATWSGHRTLFLALPLPLGARNSRSLSSASHEAAFRDCRRTPLTGGSTRHRRGFQTNKALYGTKLLGGNRSTSATCAHEHHCTHRCERSNSTGGDAVARLMCHTCATTGRGWRAGGCRGTPVRVHDVRA